MRHAALVASMLLTAALSGACDQGSQSDQRTRGPFVHLVAANVGPDRRLPPDGDILLTFDRLLLPATITRQAFLVYDAFGNAQSPTVKYDPVTRLVTLANPQRDGSAWLRPDQPYTIVFPIAEGEDDSFGVRAIDRATFDPASPTRLGFLTTLAAEGRREEPPAMRFCTDVLPLFEKHCSSPSCHGPPLASGNSRAASGLLLSTPKGLWNTAIGRVANASNTGPRALEAPPSREFGLDMPIIAPGNAGSSFLLYKMLIAQPAPPGGLPAQRLKCDGSNGTPPHAPFEPPIPFLALSEEERERLTDRVTGNVMPYPARPGSEDRTNNLSEAELLRISAWIAQGAHVEECGACEP